MLDETLYDSLPMLKDIDDSIGKITAHTGKPNGKGKGEAMSRCDSQHPPSLWSLPHISRLSVPVGVSVCYTSYCGSSLLVTSWVFSWTVPSPRCR
jgi:hypothetical protein